MKITPTAVPGSCRLGDESLAYHLGELEIARTPGDPRRILPSLPKQFDRILDLGCGIGQTLITCQFPPHSVVCGVDIDEASLAFGKQRLAPDLLFVCARGEQLPFADDSFDVVISRVALPSMHIPRVLQEIVRILKPGGHVWFTLHPFPMLRDRLLESLSLRKVKRFIFMMYVLMNGMCLHLTGKQFRYPLDHRRCESFQTVGGMTRAMHRAGFTLVCTHLDAFFAITAVKER